MYKLLLYMYVISFIYVHVLKTYTFKKVSSICNTTNEYNSLYHTR